MTHVFSTCAAPFSAFIILFHTASALSAPSGHLPLEGKAGDTRIASSKRRRSRPCESIRSPNTVIPSEAEGSLLHCRHMPTYALTQTTPWCFLFAFPSLTIYRSARRIPLLRPSGHARKTDRLISFFIPLRKVVPLRGTLSCAFGAGRLASQEGALMGRLGASLD